MALLNIELECEVLEWEWFEHFAYFLENNAVLAEYAFAQYREITVFISSWCCYRKDDSKGIPQYSSSLTRHSRILGGGHGKQKQDTSPQLAAKGSQT